MNTNKVIMYTDGGARGNPGPAGIGVVLTNSELEKRNEYPEMFGKYIGETTNNQAEYQALIAGLKRASELGVTELSVYMDSELVVRQLNGEYKVKDPGLGKLFLDVHNLQQKFRRVTFHHIPRSQNKLADTLVNEAIDKYESIKTLKH